MIKRKIIFLLNKLSINKTIYNTIIWKYNNKNILIILLINNKIKEYPKKIKIIKFLQEDGGKDNKIKKL